MLDNLARRWPLVRQILERADGTGPEAMSERTRGLLPRNAGAHVARSVCPYCAVGCGQLVFHEGNRLLSIEGDPASPVSRGRLCPKGAASYELLTHSQRLAKGAFLALGRLVEASRARVPIAASFPLRSADQAHRRLARGHVLGRIVLRVRPS